MVLEQGESLKKIEAKVDDLTEQAKSCMSAFPDGPVNHRLSHEAMIKAAQAQENFWKEMKIDLAKKGAWGLFIIILGLVITGLQAKFGLWTGSRS
jgi:hypothetical protein